MSQTTDILGFLYIWYHHYFMDRCPVKAVLREKRWYRGHYQNVWTELCLLKCCLLQHLAVKCWCRDSITITLQWQYPCLLGQCWSVTLLIDPAVLECYSVELLHLYKTRTCWSGTTFQFTSVTMFLDQLNSFEVLQDSTVLEPCSGSVEVHYFIPHTRQRR